MVSKVAVIALVAILAVPILLGYGMNMNETTEIGYRPSQFSPTNVTNQLLNGNTGSTYSYIHGDTYKMNTNFVLAGQDKYPAFNNIMTENGSLQFFQAGITNQTYSDYAIDLKPYTIFFIQFTSPIGVDYFTTTGGVESYTGYKANVHSIYVEHKITGSNEYWDHCYFKTYSGSEWAGSVVNGNVSKISISGGPTDGYLIYRYTPDSGIDNNRYVDFGYGYYFPETYKSTTPSLWPEIDLPDYTKQFTITMDLDSITDSNYALHLDIIPTGVARQTVPYSVAPMEIKKTTTNGISTWTLTNEADSSEEVTELYLDPQLTDNTYQFTARAECVYDETTQKYYVVIHVTAAYIGSWQKVIGIANPYKTYELDYYIRDIPALIYNSPVDEDDLGYYKIQFYAENGARSPTMRVDDALYRAFDYQTFTNRTLSPGQYKSNPSTTISEIKSYGSSLTYGGHTYTVKDGKITINGHSVPLNNISFTSIINGLGTYDNKIGDTLVSTSAEPSSITFNGSWAANVAIQEIESYTYVKTEWVPGQFAWDGIDDDFLIVGLMTCLGVFIALGIYAKKRNASIWPLMLVCGCAAMLFLFML